MQNFIQEYLDRGLFNIADNEERLLKLQASAESLAEEFIKSNIFLVQFLRASLAEKVDEESPALIRIEEHIKASWSTFRSAQPQRPIAILLAVGWNAVQLAVVKRSELTALIWYGSANLLTAEKIDPKLELVIDFVQVQGCNLEKRAAAAWKSGWGNLTEQVRFIAIPPVKIDLQQALLKASASVNHTTEAAIDGGNPHLPEADGAWASVFAKSASATIACAFTELTRNINESVDATFNEFARSHSAQSRSTQLLWLAESLFSPRLKKSYRELTLNEAVLVLAADMAEAASGVSPQSVEYFLVETIESLFTKQDVKLESLVKDISKSPVRIALPQALFEQPEGTSHLGLLELVGAIAANEVDIKKFAERTGLPKNATKPLGDVARWLYREIKFTECLNEDLWS